MELWASQWLYVSGSTQGSEFWADLLKVSSLLETFDSFGELLSSLELSNSKLFISEDH